jgi:hypothetical protein
VLGTPEDLGEDTPIVSKQVGTQSVPTERLIPVPETSTVLNIILHVLYGTSSAQHSPTFDALTTAVDRMPFYDLVPKQHIIPRTPLYDLLLTHAPLFPIQLYTLAGHHELYGLAVATSSHLLSYPLANLPEEMAERMGALYLKKLLCLHLDRFNALKDILLSPPHPHPPTKECSFTEQKKLTRAWALVAAYLAWDARPGTPLVYNSSLYASAFFCLFIFSWSRRGSDQTLMRVDLSTHSMRSAFQPLTENLSCNLCHEGLQKRIKDSIVQWASVKVHLLFASSYLFQLCFFANSAPYEVHPVICRVQSSQEESDA